METDGGQIITYSRISDGTHTDLSFTGNFFVTALREYALAM